MDVRTSPRGYARCNAGYPSCECLRGIAKSIEVGEHGPMNVRLLEDKDLDEAAAVWHASRKKIHTTMGFESERSMTAKLSQQVFREFIASRNQVWGAFLGKEMVGILAIRGSDIDRMYVKPSQQRRGIGAALLEKARELSPSGLELHTHQANEGSRAFYEKHGFRAVRFGVSPPPESEADVEYHWKPV